MELPFLSTRALIPTSFATIKVNIYECTHVITEMENEGMQQTFQLLSKYEEESLFGIFELTIPLNISTRSSETFFPECSEVIFKTLNNPNSASPLSGKHRHWSKG